MRWRSASIVFAAPVTPAACGAGDERPDRAAAETTETETIPSDAENPIRGRTIRWTWVDGPPADDVYAVSYVAESGYTLTAVLDFRTNRPVGFASGASEWFPGRGTFEVVD